VPYNKGVCQKKTMSIPFRLIRTCNRKTTVVSSSKKIAATAGSRILM
jgi:hypothetical protein